MDGKISERYRIYVGSELGIIATKSGILLYSSDGKMELLRPVHIDNLREAVKHWSKATYLVAPSLRVAGIKVNAVDAKKIIEYESIRKALFQGLFGADTNYFRSERTKLSLSFAGHLQWLRCPLEEQEGWEEFCDSWNSKFAVRKPHEKVCENCGHAFYYEDHSVGIFGTYKCDSPDISDTYLDSIIPLMDDKKFSNSINEFEGCASFKERARGSEPEWVVE